MNAKNIDSQSESTRLYRAWQNANIIIIIGVFIIFFLGVNRPLLTLKSF